MMVILTIPQDSTLKLGVAGNKK